MATSAIAPTRPLTAAERVHEMLVAQHTALRAHEAGVRAGGDTDELRRFRVATRRLRAILRAARPLLEPEWADGHRAELAWLARAAGPARDLDVLLDHVRLASAHFEPGERFVLARMLAGLAEERSAAHADLVEALGSDRYRLLVSRLGRELASLRVSLPGEPVGELAAAEFAKLRRARRKLGEQPADVALHDLRLRVKRARYAAELAEDEVGAAASLFVRRAKAVQDLLGEHQDATTAEARLRQALRRPQSVRYALAAGRLIERQHLRRAEVRAGFPAAWSALEKQGRATWRKHPRGA